MKYPLVVAAALAALALGASNASAFTIVTGDSSTEGKANLRLADPSDLRDNMANQSSPGGTQTMQFGRTQLRITGSTSNGDGPVNSPFLSSPSASMVPSFGH
jgi:hypothetical protein